MLAGVRVLVTGAGRAIGAATSAELARRGHEVVATARHPQLLADLPVALRLELDVGDEVSVRRALEDAGELDAVVNNAAVNFHGPLEALSASRLAEMFDSNVIGALRVVQPLLPAWRARGTGVIVNVSSVQGKVATPLEGGYSATKHALEAVSDVLHYELGHFGIRVVVIEPGYIAPGMVPRENDVGPGAYDGLRAQWAGVVASVTGGTGRSAPETVATAIATAIEDPKTPRRIPVGADAEAVLALREAHDDAGFEAAMRELLGLTW